MGKPPAQTNYYYYYCCCYCCCYCYCYCYCYTATATATATVTASALWACHRNSTQQLAEHRPHCFSRRTRDAYIIHAMAGFLLLVLHYADGGFSAACAFLRIKTIALFAFWACHRMLPSSERALSSPSSSSMDARTAVRWNFTSPHVSHEKYRECEHVYLCCARHVKFQCALAECPPLV